MEGTERLADLCPGPCDSSPYGVTLLGKTQALLSATDGVHGREPWRWTPGTNRVEPFADLCLGECSSNPQLEVALDEDRSLITTQTADGTLVPRIITPDGLSDRPLADLAGLELHVFSVLLSGEDVPSKATRDHWIFWAREEGREPRLWSVPLSAPASSPPEGPSLTSDELPGFSFKVRIGGEDGILGRAEPACLPETLCVSGALEGRSEVFVRVVGPKPNGRLWPTLVKFTTSTVDVWIEQLATGIVRHYQMEGASPGSSELPGLFDRDGFPPH